MTVRELIKAMQVEIRDTPDLQPDRASELRHRLAALLGNINDEIRAADMDYAGVLAEAMRTEKKANRAKILAETSPAYWRKREAYDTKELVVQLGRALHDFLDAKREEMRLSR